MSLFILRSSQSLLQIWNLILDKIVLPLSHQHHWPVLLWLVKVESEKRNLFQTKFNKLLNIGTGIKQEIMSMQSPLGMNALEKKFILHSSDSPILATIWKTMMLMAMFRNNDRQFLRKLILEDHNHEVSFLNSFIRFQINESQRGDGSFRLGGLKGQPTSLSQEVLNRKVPRGSEWVNKVNQDFGALLYGECAEPVPVPLPFHAFSPTHPLVYCASNEGVISQSL